MPRRVSKKTLLAGALYHTCGSCGWWQSDPPTPYVWGGDVTTADTCAKPYHANCWEAVILSSKRSYTIVLCSFRLNEFLNSPFGIAGCTMVVRSNKVETATRGWALPEFYVCAHTCSEDHSTEWVFRLCFWPLYLVSKVCIVNTLCPQLYLSIPMYGCILLNLLAVCSTWTLWSWLWL